MIILPAIDLRDGQCVRLQKGDFGTTHKVAESPAAAASSRMIRRLGTSPVFAPSRSTMCSQAEN